MPGLYLYQVDDTFYHYGGPLESGANPQTTAVYAPSGESFVSGPLRNQLSSAELWQYTSSSSPPRIEIKHVDGSIARFEAFAPYVSTWVPAGRQLWRLTKVVDPYDNAAVYAYNSLHQLTSITFPSGLSQIWTWTLGTSTDWPGWSGSTGHDRLMIRYLQGGSTSAEGDARTWGIVFHGQLGTSNGRFFGKRIHRVYSSPRTLLADFAFTTGSEVTGQLVSEFVYDGTSTPRALTEHHKVHTGTPFHETLSTPSTPSPLADAAVMELTYDWTGRVASQSRLMVGETLTFAYPTSGFRTTDLLTGTWMAGIEATNATGTKRRYEFDMRSGRLYSVITTPSNDLAGQPRKTHLATENSGIGGAAAEVEPDRIEIYNVYDTSCICKKPVEQRMISTRGTATETRVWNFEYDPLSTLVTKRKEPNPEAGPGPFLPQVEWTYTYTRAMNNGTSGQAWGAWLPLTEVTPDGTFTYTYSNWLDRQSASEHGQIAGTTQRSISGVRIQDTLSGSPSTSSSPVAETIHRNLPNSPGGMSPQGVVAGMPRKVIDGDGVETVFEYTTQGRLERTIVDGDRKTAMTYDAVGNVTAMVANEGTSHAATTTFDLILGAGVPWKISSTSGGLTRETRVHYDRWGHVTAVRQNNLDSTGSKPSEHGGSGASARDWIETRYVFHHLRLLEVLEDRLPRDEAGGTGQFLSTEFVYGSDGRLSYVQHPNGAKTEYDFDGFGTLYRSVTKDPAGTVSVRSPKRFVNHFLEVVGSYEFTGTDHLWTLVERNDAGAIVTITEPSTTAPTGYSPDPITAETYSTGGAVHRYEVDKLGRVTKAESFANGSSTTALTSRLLRHDQLFRQIWQSDAVLGFGSGNRDTAWRYIAGKATQLLWVETTGVAATTYSYYGDGLLQQVRDGFSTGNTVEYAYHTGTPFPALVLRTDLDPSGTPRVTSTAFDVDPFGRVVAIQEGTPQLVHSYAYDSLGRVDRYTDPAGKVQKFLGDGQGRIVEHVRLGAGSDFIHNATTFEDEGFADGRTKMSRFDGLGNVTVTHYDFAGRAFIVQNPGGDVAPTASAPNQSRSLFAEYDGASRLKTLFDGDLGKTTFWRDGRGRMILRKLENQTVGGASSVDKIAQWNTLDWVRRDAIGRIRMADYWGGTTGASRMGIEQFDHYAYQQK